MSDSKYVKITWLGTASLKIETSDTFLFVDPFIGMDGCENKNSVSDFLGSKHILITHPHLDHLMSVPEILKLESPNVYCTETAVRLLKEDAGERENIIKIQPGDIISVGNSISGNNVYTGNNNRPESNSSPDNINVKVLKGRHIQFDNKLVLKTLRPSNVLKKWDNAKALLHENMHYQENGETVVYCLEIYDFKILVMGSLALDDETEYPEGADLLCLPYQGSSNLVDVADGIIKRLRPRQIFVTHFDDSFPPISHTIPTEPLVDMAAKKYPETKILVPEFAKAYMYK